MKKFTLILLLVIALTAVVALTSSAVSGAGFTTFNPSVDGSPKDLCKNSIINCNIYSAKEYVWLNGGPAANGLGPDGLYFFAVLEPGGQPNPNDQGGVADKNLSDDYDLYTNRTFTVTDGEVSAYDGDHWLDSNTQAPDGCKNGNGPQTCDGPDDQPPYIRLFPYSDTTNPGGVYIMAICSLEDGYPVDPRDCKYDAFKVKAGRVTYDFMLEGYKFHDLNADGLWGDEPGLPGWTITIDGTGFSGEEIHATATTGDSGYWQYQSQEYTFSGQDAAVSAVLTVCEVLQTEWYQSAPDPACYDLTIEPSAAALVSDLNFGNYQPVSITAKKFYDRDQDGERDDSEAWIEGFQFCLYAGDETSTTYVGDADFVVDPEPACQSTDKNGTVTWDNLLPGTYTVKEEGNEDYWIPTGPIFATLTLTSGESGAHAFGNVAICDGLTPGYWSNWRNHYTEEQFLFLLQGTIADGDISLADSILASVGCDGDDSLHCMRRFLLANQLTLNLTMYLDLPNPDGAELYLACQLDVDHSDVEGTLGDWLAQALAIHDADGVGYTREEILWVKTVLDWFANMNFRPF